VGEYLVRLTVFSHKLCWPSDASSTGYATSGGFSFQMAAISDLFDSTRIVVPVESQGNRVGEILIAGNQVTVVPLDHPTGSGLRRKLAMLGWLFRDGPVILREVRRADAVHVPIPSDIGTVGMVLAYLLRKPLYVRHCGNWDDLSTNAKRFWRWFIEQAAGGRNVMFATGGASEPPSQKNPNIQWIFSTSLTADEIRSARKVRERPSQPPRLIIACRQEREKGSATAIRALHLALQKNPVLHLDIVGDGTILDELKALAHQLGVESNMTFHGQVSHREVLRLLHQADIFCYPTQASEGFPKSVLEALACGLPVITTRISVLPQLIGDCAGILLDEATPDATRAAIDALLYNETTYCNASNCALETAQGYSLEAWGAFIEDHLRAAWGPLRDTQGSSLK
jgi:glycosyltransferase involved in cell wall biosynthesis